MVLEPAERLRGCHVAGDEEHGGALLADPAHRVTDLFVRAVRRIEAHDPATGLDDPRETLAVITGHTERGCERAARCRDLEKLRFLILEGLEAR